MPRTAHIVVGLGFGDEGKGSIVDYLVRSRGAGLVVRFNGGAQAGHNVITPGGVHHEFHQFGAGTLAGARTHLTRHVMVNPDVFLREAGELAGKGVADPLSLVTIHREALITTPYHIAANRAIEAKRGDGRHGSCGMGIGETARQATVRVPGMKALRALHLQRLAHGSEARTSLMWHRNMALELGAINVPDVQEVMEHYGSFSSRVRIIDTPEERDLLWRVDSVFEGAQGVLLDQEYGFFPHVTHSDCTFRNAVETLAGLPVTTRRIGVLRSYATRHGAGPFPSAALAMQRSEPHNTNESVQGEFRTGAFDLPLARYALEVVGAIDGLALTHLDRFCPAVCESYQNMRRPRPLRPTTLEHQQRLTSLLYEALPVLVGSGASDGESFAHHVQRSLDVSVAIRSFGPTAADKVA